MLRFHHVSTAWNWIWGWGLYEENPTQMCMTICKCSHPWTSIIELKHNTSTLNWVQTKTHVSPERRQKWHYVLRLIYRHSQDSVQQIWKATQEQKNLSSCFYTKTTHCSLLSPQLIGGWKQWKYACTQYLTHCLLMNMPWIALLEANFILWRSSMDKEISSDYKANVHAMYIRPWI